jgi:hypothetical protein
MKETTRTRSKERSDEPWSKHDAADRDYCHCLATALNHLTICRGPWSPGRRLKRSRPGLLLAALTLTKFRRRSAAATQLPKSSLARFARRT